MAQKRTPAAFSGSGLAIFAWLAITAGAFYIYHKPISAPIFYGLLTAAWRTLTAFLILAPAGGLGRVLLPGLPLRPAARAAVHAAAGLGLLGLAVLAIGTFLGLAPWLLWGFLLLLTLTLRRRIRSWLFDLGDVLRLARAGGGFVRVTALLCAAGLVLAWAAAAAPPVKFDALVYHLALPQTYISAGRLAYVPENVYWGMPQLAEMLYTWTLALSGAPETAALLGWLAGVVTLVGVLGYTAQPFGVRSGWAAVGALLAGATLLEGLSWAYVDWFAMLFGLGVIVCLNLALEIPGEVRPRLVLFAGMFAGLAFGTKYTAGVAALAGAAVLAASPLFAGRFPDRLKALAGFLGVALLFAGPWLLRNFAATGNPLYPFVIPSGEMTALRLDLYAGRPPWGGLAEVLLLPWGASITGLEGAPGFAATIGPVLLAFGALAGVGWRDRAKRGRLRLVQLAVFTLAGIGVWMAASRFSLYLVQSRLYFVFFPAAAILAGAGFQNLERFRWPGVRLGRIAGVLLGVVLGLNVFQLGTEVLQRGAFQVITRQKPAGDYLAESLGMYQFAMSATAELPDSFRVLLLFEPRGLPCLPGCDADEILDRWKTDAEAARHVPEEILAGWQEAGYTHVLYHRAGAEFFRDDPRYRLDDWLVLNAVIITLEPVIDLGGVYALFALP